MPLEEYRRKRDPARTPEPMPAAEPSPGPPEDVDETGTLFVIQEHHARSLHWDLRLERAGVLASWAVPKGLPSDPDTVRLAVRTEDHPMEYRDFSGDIPRGEYGAGRMSIWDHGSYQTLKWTDTEVQVVLHGQRVQGRYILLRRGRGPKDWLLRRGAPASTPGWHPPPTGLSPMAATPGTRPEPDRDWCFEVRFGGTPVLVRVDGGRVELADSSGNPLSDRHPELSGLGAALGATPVLLDAEIGGTPPGLWVHDLLYLDGRDVTALPYRERRELAESLPLSGSAWRLTPSYPGSGAAVLAAAAEQGLRTVVAKRADSRYVPGARSEDWIEIPVGAQRPAPRRSPAAGVRVAGRQVRLTNPDKVLYPDSGLTKRDVLDYYLAVAPAMLAHLSGRPVTLRRWPDGVAASSFFEKNVSRHAPSWVRTVRLDTPGSASGSEYLDYPLLDDEAGVAWIANLAALELHVPQWRVDEHGQRRNPDLLVFDLDPGEGASIVECARVAERIVEVLAEDGLAGYPRTSGGKGMQLYSPVQVAEPRQTGEYARALAQRLADETPTKVVAEMAKRRRRGKVFIDWSQNNPVKTTIASYSLRGRALPTVATPLTWDEVRACEHAEQLVFTSAQVPERLAEHGDLLAPLLGPGHPLPVRR